MPKYAAKVDSTQLIIVEVFRKRGYQVKHLHTLGKGWPDLLVNKNGRSFFIEVKNPDKYKKDGTAGKGTFTKEQIRFYAEWQGSKIYVIKSQEEALSFQE